MNVWSSWLEEIRAAPRQDPGRTQAPSGPARRVVQARQRLAAEGTCVWGYLALAANTVWEGTISGSACVLYSHDPWFEARPFELRHAAEAFTELGQAADPAAHLVGSRDVFGPTYGVRLPADLTRGRVIAQSTTWVRLDDLPGRAIRNAILPLWVDGEGLTIPVTAPHWPVALRQAWDED